MLGWFTGLIAWLSLGSEKLTWEDKFLQDLTLHECYFAWKVGTHSLLTSFWKSLFTMEKLSHVFSPATSRFVPAWTSTDIFPSVCILDCSCLCSVFLVRLLFRSVCHTYFFFIGSCVQLFLVWSVSCRSGSLTFLWPVLHCLGCVCVCSSLRHQLAIQFTDIHKVSDVAQLEAFCRTKLKASLRGAPESLRALTRRHETQIHISFTYIFRSSHYL